jgi:flagellar hook-associated protein 3 FlgL
MTIGTALLGRIATGSFAKLRNEIGDLQSRISSGTNDPRPSADLARAAELSSLKERRSVLSDYSASAESASNRLALTDVTLADMNDIARQFQSIALQAANDTQTDAGLDGLRSQAIALRSALIADANTVDSAGQGLFSGFAAGPAFKDGAAGAAYAGDGGVSVVRLSESVTLPTGLNGEKLLMAVPTKQGPTSMFKMVDDLIATLGIGLRSMKPTATVTGQADLTLAAGREPQALGFTLKGPKGAVRIDTTMQAGTPSLVMDAINAQTALTGVAASLAPDGSGIRLAAEGSMTLSGFDSGSEARAAVARLQPLDNAGQPAGASIQIRPEYLSADRMVAAFGDATSHLAGQRAEAGAVAAQVDRQKEALSARSLQLDTAVSNLEDLDVAKAITRLQDLLLSQQAAQQTFVKIQSSNLFDYIR